VVVNNPSHLELVRIRPAIHIPNGVGPAAAPIRRARPYVAWVANLKPSKRPEACIGLAEAIEDLGVDVVMVGRAQVAEYEGFAARTDLPANLVLLGPLPPREAEGVLAGALVHVHTCRPEGFPNVFLQAWRAGVPSVSLGFDPGGTIVREGLGSCADDDVERFHDEVRGLIVDDARRSAAGARARAYVAANADADRNTAALVAFIGDITGAAA
jgi:glycosyltransferase involved in cell wall biosynthesis